MLLAGLVEVSARVAATSARTKKISALSDFLRALESEDAPAAVSYLSGRPLQSPLGVGPAAVGAIKAHPADTPNLAIHDVDMALEEISHVSGQGSTQRRSHLLHELFSSATKSEQAFLRGLLVRNLRQGALDGVMVEAASSALGVPAERVRRAAMVEGDLVAVVSSALVDGVDVLDVSGLSVGTPVQPMLAKTAESVSQAMADLGDVIVEHKLDGLRVQVHKDNDQVLVFSRNLRDITGEVPEVVSDARQIEAQRLILDGEALLVDEGGKPRSFQESMSLRDEVDAEFRAFYFDLLHVDGEDLIDFPLSVRRSRLTALLSDEQLVDATIPGSDSDGEQAFEQAVANGFEGVVVKELSSSYSAGRRGSGWLKVKPVHTLDLVVLAAEWGSGRRRGWLSNLHLGARHGDEFLMLGKTFKGLTDDMLAWQTERFLSLERERDGRVVYLNPEVVYEIAFDGVQRSSRYPGGVALRFARVKRYREDKNPDDADTLETVRDFLR